MKLQDKTAIVTGGGRGIGKAIAMQLAHDGADIVIASPDDDEAQTTAEQIRQLSRQCFAVHTDVTDESHVRDMVEETLRQFGRIDVLVNNAGIIGPTVAVQDVSRNDWDDVIAVNLTGAFLCCKAVLPSMISQRAGKIINISSIAGKIGYPLRSPYAVSKWGLIGLTMTLAKENGPHNIQVNAVCPGPVEGERIEKVFRDKSGETNKTTDEIKREYVQAMALNRLVRAEDIAEMVAFLASASGDNITGQAIEVSAGWGL